MAWFHVAIEVLPGVSALSVISIFFAASHFRNGKQRQERQKRSMKKQKRSTKRVAGCPAPLPRSKRLFRDWFLFIWGLKQKLFLCLVNLLGRLKDQQVKRRRRGSLLEEIRTRSGEVATTASRVESSSRPARRVPLTLITRASPKRRRRRR